MPLLDTLKYDNLFAGDFDVITEEITIDVSQTIKRGDVLKKTAGKFGRPAAVLITADVVVIASEDITTDGATTVKSIGYKTGWFNQFAMRFGGASTADDNHDILAEKAIYLTKTQKQ
ncbi:hypothetical protein E4K67_17425 [Desulfosporosinus fructosivorans]|uniref:Head decoration protein n=1 Tax=Desulfosporosinus fructosivorans TaxID=2018669 RepID=A0A4Z0R288_9FIRM|nr:hypothetical protein [Desulfosporosinus fructosivorans]TGE36880.1 hypothetical protein E4K67_17425 [Desulfosporosinus fructosivorans]